MSAQVLPPNERWPTHKKPWWRSALDDARAAGWTLHYLGAPHAFGSVSCPAGQHTFDVDQTAKGGDRKAAQAALKIQRCTHRASPDAPVATTAARLRRCNKLISTAEELTANAGRSVEALEAEQAARALVADLEEQWERLELILETAELTLDEAAGEDRLDAVLEDRESELAQVVAALEGEMAALDALPAPPHPADVTGTLETAAVAVDDATAEAQALGRARSHMTEPLLERAQAVRVRIQDLRDRLEAVRNGF